MQKKLIALAVAGLASTAAFAQTNVTIYGLVDYGYAYRFDARGVDSLVNGISANKPGSSSQLNGGQQSGNRLGFKGTEDLGNGLKAVFLLEQGYQLDTGASANASSFYNRQAYVGLSGGFGTAVGGRLYTPHYTFVSGLDPFGAGTVGRYNNVYSIGAGAVSGSAFGNLTDPVRVDNAIAYISPSFGGFTVTAAFSNNASGDDSNSNNAQNNTVYALLGQYTGGALTVGANYHYIAGGSSVSVPSATSNVTLANAQLGTLPQAGLTSTLTGVRIASGASSWADFPVDNVQNFTLGGSYDFKVAKVMALYSWNNIDFTPLGGKDIAINNYMLGATVPFGKFAAKGSYIYSDGNSAAGGDAQQLALGLDYNLSKRTNFYSAYSWIDNSDKRINGVGDASASGSYSAGNGNPAGVWQQGFQVGLRHMF
jgi:predicted porin